MNDSRFKAFNLRVSNLIHKLNKITDESISSMDIYVKGLIRDEIIELQTKKYNRVTD